MDAYEIKVDLATRNGFGLVGSIMRLPGNGLYTIGVDFVSFEECTLKRAREAFERTKNTTVLRSFVIGGPINEETFHHHRQGLFRDETLVSCLKMILDTAVLECHLEYYKRDPQPKEISHYGDVVDCWVQDLALTLFTEKKVVV